MDLHRSFHRSFRDFLVSNLVWKVLQSKIKRGFVSWGVLRREDRAENQRNQAMIMFGLIHRKLIELKEAQFQIILEVKRKKTGPIPRAKRSEIKDIGVRREVQIKKRNRRNQRSNGKKIGKNQESNLTNNEKRKKTSELS